MVANAKEGMERDPGYNHPDVPFPLGEGWTARNFCHLEHASGKARIFFGRESLPRFTVEINVPEQVAELERRDRDYEWLKFKGHCKDEGDEDSDQMRKVKRSTTVLTSSARRGDGSSTSNFSLPVSRCASPTTPGSRSTPPRSSSSPSAFPTPCSRSGGAPGCCPRRLPSPPRKATPASGASARWTAAPAMPTSTTASCAT